MNYTKIVTSSPEFLFMETVVANYGWITKDGKYAQCDVHMCHAGLNHFRKERADYVAIASEVMKPPVYYGPPLSGKIKAKYYDWLLHRSPVSHVFISKGVKKVFKDKLVFLSTEHPLNVIMAACIMHRHIWEIPLVPKTWFDLVNAGMDEDAAFAVAHLIYPLAGDKCMIRLNVENTNHTIFDGHIFNDTLINFVNHNLVGATGTTYRADPFVKQKSVRGIFSPHSSHTKNQQDLLPILRQKTEHLRTISTRPKSNNPFDSYCPPPAQEMDYNQTIKALADALPQILEECANA